MKCPKCHKKIDLAKQIAEWDKEFGSDVAGWAMIAIFCPHCEDQVFMIELYETPDTQEIYSPALKKKVVMKVPKGFKFPKDKKKKKL